MSAQLIPLDPTPNQSFEIALSVDGALLTLRLDIAYNEVAGYWLMRISSTDGTVLLDSIPLITGTWPAANVLAQYQYLAIGSAFVLNVANAIEDYPDSASLGSDFLLVWDDTAP